MNPGPHLAPAVILAQLGERREELIAGALHARCCDRELPTFHCLACHVHALLLAHRFRPETPSRARVRTHQSISTARAATSQPYFVVGRLRACDSSVRSSSLLRGRRLRAILLFEDRRTPMDCWSETKSARGANGHGGASRWCDALRPSGGENRRPRTGTRPSDKRTAVGRAHVHRTRATRSRWCIQN